MRVVFGVWCVVAPQTVRQTHTTPRVLIEWVRQPLGISLTMFVQGSIPQKTLNHFSKTTWNLNLKIGEHSGNWSNSTVLSLFCDPWSISTIFVRWATRYFAKLVEILTFIVHFSGICVIFHQMSTRSETGNVVYIDAILKSTQNSRVQWSVQLLSNFGGQIPNHLREMFFSPGSTILSY